LRINWKINKFVGTIPASKVMAVGEIEREMLKYRYLTPRECFRLMGFDDDDFNKILLRKIGRSQLYALAGNSIVVDVLESIFKELMREIDFAPINKEFSFKFLENKQLSLFDERS
jgi:DNA (cytosine-5)-methyltransferase 1